MSHSDEFPINYYLHDGEIVTGGCEAGAPSIAEIALIASLGPFITAFCTELGKRFGGTFSDWASRIWIRGWKARPHTAEIEIHEIVIEIDDTFSDEAKLALLDLDITSDRIRGHRLSWDKQVAAWIVKDVGEKSKKQIGS